MAPPLKSRLAAGERLLGVLLRTPAEELTEMVAVAGFDFLFLDAEHGPADVGSLRQHIAAAALHGMPVLVRVGGDEPQLVLRALDAGAAGVVGPRVDTPAQARALVDAAHYPPLGRRGFATYGRAGRFGTTSPQEHRETMLAETVVIGMIESPEGVAAARSVLSVPGLDGTMVGTADLAAASTAEDPDPAASVATVHRVAAELGVLRMDIVSSADRAAASFADGAQMVVYNLTAELMAHFRDLTRVDR